MEKFIPYEKLSKKKQRELNALKRKTWGNVNPVTRRPENPKAYNRQKARKWSDGSGFAPFYLYIRIVFISDNVIIKEKIRRRFYV